MMAIAQEQADNAPGYRLGKAFAEGVEAGQRRNQEKHDQAYENANRYLELVMQGSTIPGYDWNKLDATFTIMQASPEQIHGIKAHFVQNAVTNINNANISTANFFVFEDMSSDQILKLIDGFYSHNENKFLPLEDAIIRIASIEEKKISLSGKTNTKSIIYIGDSNR
jgi:hypothetical protein